MIMKILVLVVLAAIVLSLFTGLGFLVRGDARSKGMVNALTVRIVLSVLLFILLFVAWRLGMLTPQATGK
jgi:ammonia channel protein AmtB